MTKKKLFLIIAAVFVLQFPVFYQFWLGNVARVLIYQDTIAPSDAIVVLGGGRGERVLQGVELYEHKFAPVVLFTGDFMQPLYSPPLHWAEQAVKYAESEGMPKDKMTIIYGAKSTRDDALLTRRYCEQQGYRSLIVTTEPYHSRRAKCVFTSVFKGSGIRVAVHPVQRSWYTPHSWWHSEDGISLTIAEYIKFVYYLFRGYLG